MMRLQFVATAAAHSTEHFSIIETNFYRKINIVRMSNVMENERLLDKIGNDGSEHLNANRNLESEKTYF